MISPGERREVAREMRDVTDTELYVMYLDEILCGILGDKWCRDGDFQISSELILLRLADLIDPTCHPVPSDGGFFTCSECGERIGAVLPAIGTVLMHHCAHCGARVTSGGED